MKEYNYLRVGAIVPKLSLANPEENALEILKIVKEAVKKEIAIVVTPELSLTGYTCGDLFYQEKLLDEALSALDYLKKATKDLNIVIIVGLPLYHDNQIFNVAAVLNKGKIIGLIPKTYIPNYSEFYEKRWFASSTNLVTKEIQLLGEKVPITTNIIFRDTINQNMSFAIELCEDLWVVNPPSNKHTLMGANIIFNLSSSNEIIGKKSYRQDLVKMQSAKTISGYIYASSGLLESTSDIVFSGTSLIYERGSLLKENKAFDLASNLIYADIDIGSIVNDRRKNISYMGVIPEDNYLIQEVNLKNSQTLERNYSKFPFVPSDILKRDERCQEIITITSNALVRRLVQLNNPKCIIGISGGLDSTLAFLITTFALQKLGLSNENIIGVTMPGFGTSKRTHNNALKLLQEYKATIQEVDIKDVTSRHLKDIGLPPNDHSVVYENAQARERTQILMDIANKEHGIVIGTGDLSELALGWCTYNGDHMSMYGLNSAIPKTLVKYLVAWFRDNTPPNIKKIITDIIDTPISPELLPPTRSGKITQQTEITIGPYTLHDFFLYHFLRFNESPKKIYYLATKTFNNDFTKEEIINNLEKFIQRFFTMQFKRNCLPDGIKVGTISLSPRGDLRMPSDATYAIWQKELTELKKEL